MYSHVVCTHSKEFEMFCSVISWSPSLSGTTLDDATNGSYADPVSLSYLSEQSAMRQAVPWWSIAIGGTDTQVMFLGKVGGEREREREREYSLFEFI